MTPRAGFRYRGRPREVRLLARPNRFLVRVVPVRGGRPFEAHLPNPGRMEELLVPGETRGWVVPAGGPGRRTQFDLVTVRHGRELVNVDSRVANRLVGAALRQGRWPGLDLGRIDAEVPYGGRRFDFAVRGDTPGDPPRVLVEVKSSNLRVGDLALFPDAPTERGRHHVALLGRAAASGVRTAVLFVIQRRGVAGFDTNRALDPAFASALDRAARAGVRVAAVATRVRPGGIALDRAVPWRPRRRRTPFVGAAPIAAVDERAAAVERDPRAPR